MSVAVVMQVRAGSTRLPRKMCLPFAGSRAIPELIASEVLRVFDPEQLVIATGSGPADDTFESLAERLGVRCHRGSEVDVLGRIVGAVEKGSASFVLRVCADNPFLRAEDLAALTDGLDHDELDFVSYRLYDGTPAVLSHVGLYAELVRRSVLDDLSRTLADPAHREHATLYVLERHDRFRCGWLPAHRRLREIPNLRLTVDTEADFRTCQELYRDVVAEHGEGFRTDELLDVVAGRPELLASMRGQISSNPKQ